LPDLRCVDERARGNAGDKWSWRKENATIIAGAGKASDIKGRIESIRQQAEEATSDHDKEKLQERVAKLSGGVAVIKVGAASGGGLSFGHSVTCAARLLRAVAHLPSA